MSNTIENVPVAPVPEWNSDALTEREVEGFAAFTEQWNHDRAQWAEFDQANRDRLAAGKLSLEWMNTDGSNWGTKVKPSSRGLTMDDINRPRCYGTVPGTTTYRDTTPRGSVREPYRHRLPEMANFVLTEKWDLWSDNVSVLYEEAKFRQWNATKDIAWDELEPVNEQLEKAACQLATVLTEIEFAAGDFPAHFIAQIPNDYLEVKLFLSTQVMDEARHLEVFRKRALAGGGGLLHVTPQFQWAIKALLMTPSHSLGGFFLNLLGEGMILSLFRAGEFLSHTPVDREIFRLCLQDEARHVAFGTIEMKHYLEHHPTPDAALEQLHRYADMVEPSIESSVLEPTVLEPLALLMGDGLDDIDAGMEGVAFLWSVIREEYLQRCDRAGFERRERCALLNEMPWNSAA
ncbi:MAG: ferritin-like domain-containing protein [Acidimicrobiia bacterium]